MLTRTVAFMLFCLQIASDAGQADILFQPVFCFSYNHGVSVTNVLPWDECYQCVTITSLITVLSALYVGQSPVTWM